MANDKDPILHRERQEWVKECGKSLIQASSIDGRFMMIREGFPAFRERVKTGYATLAGFNLTDDEARLTWERLNRYVRMKKVRHGRGRVEFDLYEKLEALHQQTKHINSRDKDPDQAEDAREARRNPEFEIETEKRGRVFVDGYGNPIRGIKRPD